MSPRKQQQVIDEIAAQIGHSAPPDIARVKRNVGKMLDMGAPEADIDAYIEEEGVTLAQLQATKADGSPRRSSRTRNVTVTFADGSTTTYRNTPDSITPDQVADRAKREFGKDVVEVDGGRPAASKAPQSHGEPKATPSPDARTIIQSVLPNAEITSWKRDPHSSLGRANPSSWHNRSGGAVDIKPIPGMTYEQVLQTIKDAGYPIIEARNEVDNPSAWATGPHYHLVLGQRPGDDEGDHPTNGDPQDTPQAPSSGMGIGDLVAGRKAPKQDDGPGFFDAPKSWEQVGHGLAVGTGDVVEGIADVPGIVLDPINTLIGRAMGYDGYVGDFGKTVREGLGLPEDKTLPGDVIKGASGGLGVSGVSRLLAKAGSGVVANGLKELGSTPVRDAAGGAGAALSSGLAQEAGLPVPVQVAAGVLGGATSALGIAKAAERAPRLLDTRAADRLVPRLAQQRFEAQQAMNRYQSLDRAISRDVEKLVNNLTAASSAKSKLTKPQQATLLDRVSALENSFLPYEDLKALKLLPSAKAKLRKAMNDRNLLSEADIDAIADGTVAGDAVADGIRKARRLRALVPEVAGKTGSPAGRFLAEALGGAAGYKLGGPLGGAAGTAAGRALTRSGVGSSADAALSVAADAKKFGRMPSEIFGKPEGPTAPEALSQLASETMDAPFLAKQEAARLEAEGRKVAVQNAKDDIVPKGGYRGYLYEQTGLTPAQQDAGALAALKDGKITQEHFEAFLNDPEKLMQGKVGLSLSDRLASMADEGKLQRDPKWTPPSSPEPSAPMVDASGAPIRSLPAYQAGAAKNIVREVDLMRQLDEVDPIRGQLGGDGPAFRDSDVGMLNEADAVRAAAIRAELAKMKPTKGKAQ